MKSLADIYFLKNTPGKHSGNGNIILIGGPNYDRYEKKDFENPTIGILLCEEKSDAMVELTLPKDANIFASEYQLYLTDKKLLQQKLREWLTEEGNIEDEI